MSVPVHAAFRLPFALRGILLFVTIMKRHAVTSGGVPGIEADAVSVEVC